MERAATKDSGSKPNAKSSITSPNAKNVNVSATTSNIASSLASSHSRRSSHSGNTTNSTTTATASQAYSLKSPNASRQAPSQKYIAAAAPTPNMAAAAAAVAASNTSGVEDPSNIEAAMLLMNLSTGGNGDFQQTQGNTIVSSNTTNLVSSPQASPAAVERVLEIRALAHMKPLYAEEPNGAPASPPEWFKRDEEHSHRPVAWVKDWVTGKIRPRVKMDDLLEVATEEKREEYLARQGWGGPGWNSDSDNAEDEYDGRGVKNP
ncbi:hypothetical protein B0H66DRAFT_625466 [Apodospora peruviana]|uniref:Uncharacterized protein n=1 Tax=Apodospora peruviana TaxID=516989 RepID=A0AAE0I0P8_9PEZI|nr:hypothetical protein B0H66DRAFT_625466 [Apodospora peruviana]